MKEESKGATVKGRKISPALKSVLEPTALPQKPRLLLRLAGLSATQLRDHFSAPSARTELREIREELETLGQGDQEQVGNMNDRINSLKTWIKDAFGVEDVDHWNPEESNYEEGSIPLRSEEIREDCQDNTGMTGEADPESLSSSGGDGSQAIQTQQSQKSSIKSEEESFPSPAPVTAEQDINAQAPSANKSDAEPRPILRIKLAAHIPASGKGTGLNSQPISPTSPSGAPPRGGTGSKNLSRMMSRPSEPDIKTKVSNQTPINVFWNYVEPYFKLIDESDLRILDDSGKFIDSAPFSIPPLGKPYDEEWRERYGYVCSSAVRRDRKRQADGTSKTVSLRERLLAMLIEENLTVPESPETDSSPGESSVDSGSQIESHCSTPISETAAGCHKASAADYVHVDERIRQELTHSGLCMFVPKIDYQEDDSICCEIRSLQKRLREQVCLNHYRKRKLLQVIKEKMAAQEFYTLLGDVNRQIEVSYAKRNKVQKKRKRGTPAPIGSISGNASPAPIIAANETLKLVETRNKLLVAFSGMILPHQEFLSFSRDPLFSPNLEEEVLKYANEGGGWLPLPPSNGTSQWSTAKGKTANAHPVYPSIINEVHNESASLT